MNNKKVESSKADRSVVRAVWRLLLTLCLLCSPGIATADYHLIIRLLGQDATALDTAAVEQAVTDLGERTRSRLVLVRQVGRDALLLAAPDISTVTELDELLGQLQHEYSLYQTIRCMSTSGISTRTQVASACRWPGTWSAVAR
jgi:hypothetical protein